MCPSRNASVHSRGKAETKMASEIRQGHHEKGDGGGLAVERDLGLAEVDLGLTRAVGQGDEDLGTAGLQAATASLTMVMPPVSRALASRSKSPGPVPPLPRGFLVVLEDLWMTGRNGSSLGRDVGPHGDSPAVRRLEDLF